jgi:hypothetical protein
MKLSLAWVLAGASPSITCTTPSFPGSPADLPQCSQLCPDGGIPSGACTEMSLTCNYPAGIECAVCICREEITNGVPALTWQCAFCV